MERLSPMRNNDGQLNLEAPIDQLSHSSLMDEPDDTGDELALYMGSKISFDVDGDVLQFWESRQHDLPLLSQLALRTYSNTGISVSEETNFSILKHLINDRRTCINAQAVSDTFVVRSFLDF